jgi:hypothetical protein
MTDHPRFQLARSEPDHCYRQHHGAVLVELTFRIADWWLKRRDATNSIGFESVQSGGEATP